jgi:hypothetical protein
MSDSGRSATIKDGQRPTIYRPDLIGPTLSEVDPALLRSESNSASIRWFHSPREVDLFVWSDQRGNLVKQQLAFWGAVVEWNLLDGIKTGVIVEDDRKKTYTASELVQFDSELSSNLLKQALDIISFIESLDLPTRQRLIRNFTDSPSIGTLKAEEFFNRFGSDKLLILGARIPAPLLMFFVRAYQKILNFLR